MVGDFYSTSLIFVIARFSNVIFSAANNINLLLFYQSIAFLRKKDCASLSVTLKPYLKVLLINPSIDKCICFKNLRNTPDAIMQKRFTINSIDEKCLEYIEKVFLICISDIIIHCIIYNTMYKICNYTCFYNKTSELYSPQ
jgi:hypothetical protein